LDPLLATLLFLFKVFSTPTSMNEGLILRLRDSRSVSFLSSVLTFSSSSATSFPRLQPGVTTAVWHVNLQP
jgi:hypothetical protein